MTYQRKNEIPQEQLETIRRIAKVVKHLRLEKKMSIEKFCSKFGIARITYSNLESSNGSFQITSLLSVLEAHQLDIKKFIKMI